MTDDLMAFLRARLDDDAMVAREAHDPQDPKTGRWIYGHFNVRDVTSATVVEHDQVKKAKHIAHHDPARVLAEVDAKRRILDEYEQACRFYDENRHAPAGEAHGLRAALLLLARPYREHPAYRAEWAPQD